MADTRSQTKAAAKAVEAKAVTTGYFAKASAYIAAHKNAILGAVVAVAAVSGLFYVGAFAAAASLAAQASATTLAAIAVGAATVATGSYFYGKTAYTKATDWVKSEDNFVRRSYRATAAFLNRPWFSFGKKTDKTEEKTDEAKKDASADQTANDAVAAGKATVTPLADARAKAKDADEATPDLRRSTRTRVAAKAK